MKSLAVNDEDAAGRMQKCSSGIPVDSQHSTNDSEHDGGDSDVPTRVLFCFVADIVEKRAWQTGIRQRTIV